MLKWADYVDMLKTAEAVLEQGSAPIDDQLRAEFLRQLAMGLSQGYFLLFQTHPDYPEFVPFENQAFLCQPNPDAIYYYSRVDGKGTYRIVGERGNAIVAGFATGREIFGTAEKPGGAFNNYDFDELELDAHGNFEVIFSEKRPDGWTGDWRYLDPRADFILIRQFNYHWGPDVDMRVAIERLDEVPQRPRMSPEETDERMQRLMKYSERLARVALAAVKRPHDQGFINKFHIHRFEEVGNGDEWPQSYFECCWEIGPDEALVLETELPQKQGYWNVQVIDGLWNQVDVLYRQSSLNGATARLSGDGKFRAVLSHKDPGYHNWLDTGDHPYGMMIGRWYRASDLPLPSLTRMKLSEVSGYLGDEAPKITPEQRKKQMRARVIGSQLRRKW